MVISPKHPLQFLGVICVALIIAALGIWYGQTTHVQLERKRTAEIAESVGDVFHYSFNVDGTLSEAPDMYASRSPYWWLNSGGMMKIDANIGRTIQGNLPAGDRWRKLYASSNPRDTDGGYHPQNIFRLVTRSDWEHPRQEVYMKVNADNLSGSTNRNESNGLLLFSNYRDGDNLYYLGIRVDGTAVIKKKMNGTYHVLTQVPLFAPGYTYNRVTHPNYIPKGIWIGLRSEMDTMSDGKVQLQLFTDVGRTGTWKLVAIAVDDGVTYGSVIAGKAHLGIRTDFMDVEFSDYKVEEM
jgi:hypothetical protein